jgi:hypothetical protein
MSGETSTAATTNPLAVTATCGANQETVDHVEGMTVTDIIDEVGQAINVFDQPKILVNGAAATEETVVPAGATVEFVKPSGKKG